MATLKGLFQEAQRGDGGKLFVTQPHTEWLERPEQEQVYSEEAITFLGDVLRKKFKHERPGRFSPSAIGECHRRVVFGYAGAPQLPPDIDNQEMMDHGTISHLKWQLEGLTMGYMTEAEVWVHDEELLSGGSMDADLHDGSIFELKTAGMFVYNKIVLDQRAPKWENLLQVHNYFLLSGADWASVVYEDRSSGQFHEFRVARDPKIEKEVLRRLRSYKSYVEEDELPPMLEMCEQRMGATYRRCPYRKVCHIPDSVTKAQDLPHDSEDGRLVPLTHALPEWAQSMIQMAERLEELDEAAPA